MASQSNSSPSFLNNTQDVLLCYFTKSGFFIRLSFVVVWTLVFFPLYLVIFHTGFQRWRQNKRSSVSHTDFFTYHAFPFELFNYCTNIVLCYAIFQSDDELTANGLDMLTFASPAVLSLHVLTCVERYLAAVFPVLYMSLRKRRWLRARNLIVLTVWLVSLSFMLLMKGTRLRNKFIPIVTVMTLMASVVVFCNVQVLRALRNPSPGEGRGVSQSKEKAFFTMSAILSVLMLRLTCGITIYGFDQVELVHDVICEVQQSECWFELPCSLLLPLLFLHRAGKLPQCRGKVQNPG